MVPPPQTHMLTPPQPHLPPFIYILHTLIYILHLQSRLTPTITTNKSNPNLNLNPRQRRNFFIHKFNRFVVFYVIFLHNLIQDTPIIIIIIILRQDPIF